MVEAVAPEVVAAVDLGSNSFHMVVARYAHGQLHVVDRMRERVGLAEGLNRERRLQDDVAERALQCLQRFGQRLADMPKTSVRAVGTNTLRQLQDAGRFVAGARKALGHRVDVVSGAEEARLIYLGVAHSSPQMAGRRLVVDIGGGSTECILGEGFETFESASLYMGCVDFSLRFFRKGRLTERNFDQAVLAAQLELRGIQRRFRKRGWDHAIGASGTISAVDAIVRANGWSAEGITRKSLKNLRRALVKAGDAARLDLPGMPPDRGLVLAGGVAVLIAVFESLHLECMVLSPGALREGVLYDLIGRIHHEDVRDRTIRVFTERYHVDLEQAERVERTALALFDRVAAAWQLDPEEDRRMLAWAARLHEIGLSVAYSGYHRHGAYLAANAVMPGFSRDDQSALATLIGGHRRKLQKELFAVLPEHRLEPVRRLCGLLRLAVRLNRSRSPEPLPALQLRAEAGVLTLAFPAGWLDLHPLTRATLEAEENQTSLLGFRVAVH